MDHVGVVVEDLEAAVAFFLALGMEREGDAYVEGESVDRLTGVDGIQADIVMVHTPDGQGGLELTRYRNPGATTAEPSAPVHTLGLRNVMFAVDDLHESLAALRAHGAEPVGEVADFDGTYRLCYVRGPAGIIVALAQEVG